MRNKITVPKFRNEQLVLMVIIVTAIGIQILWSFLDQSVPSWDDAAHLANALNYQRVISQTQIFSSDWWRELWAQSPSYTAPFIYILTVPFLNIFGKSVSSGLLVNTVFIIITVLTTYSLSKTVFSTQVSLWAAGLYLLFPVVLNVQTMYLLDYGIVAMTCLTFWTLTRWKDAGSKSEGWQWSLALGLSFGCLMLSKPTGFLFLLFPSIFLVGSFVKDHHWLRIIQFGVAIVIAWCVYGGWFAQNWLTVITSAVAANSMGKGEGDPSGDTLAGWFYYIKLLPELISLPILIAVLGFTMLWIFQQRFSDGLIRDRKSLWLILYCFGGYFFCSLATNKDSRFILPIFPVLGIFIAYSFNLFQTTWLRRLRWGITGLTVMIVLLNLFWIPGMDSFLKIPYIGYRLIHRTHLKSDFPHQQIIQSIVQDQPYLRSTIGVLSSNHEFNGENLNLYGALADFQVYARYFMNRDSKDPVMIDRELKSVNWYAVKTGNNNRVDRSLLTAVERNPQIQLAKTWPMPDTSIVSLYQRKNPQIIVEPIAEQIQQVKLEKVVISPSSDLAVNTTYQLSGDRYYLKNGLLILTWQSKNLTWNHDRGIGLGELYFEHTQHQNFRVTEHSAMLPPVKSSLSEYQLTATYLDRQTGKTFPLIVPKIEIQTGVDDTFQPNAIAKLDRLGKLFARGKIDEVFKEVATLNQYDPIQDYLTQARQAINYRIDHGKSSLDSRYTLALTQVLQRRVQPLLDNLTKIAQADTHNPYAWMYLGFIRLYNWQPQAAETAFQMVDKLPSPPPELATLKIVSSVFRGNLVQAWQRFKAVNP